MEFWKATRRNLMLITGICCFIFILLFSLSIIYYPGGSRFDQYYEGFNFFETFPSDLGRMVAINGLVNTTSRVLFSIAVTLLGIFQIYFFVNLPFMIRAKKASLILAIIGSTIGVASSILSIMIAYVPYDVNPTFHNKLIYTSAPFMSAVSLIFTIAILIDKRFPRYIGFMCLALFSLFLIFAVATGIGSTLERYDNWVIRIFGHNLLIYLESLIFGLQAVGTWKYMRESQEFGTVSSDKVEVIT